MLRRIRVVVPVCTDMWNEPVKDLMDQYKESDTQIDVSSLEKGPDSLEFGYDKAYAELPTVEECERAEKAGYDGVIIYCFADPGLNAARERLTIPVVGLCEASIHLASMLGSTFGIMAAGSSDMFGSKRIAILNRMQGYGFRHKCASIRTLDVEVLDLVKDHDKLIAQLLIEGREAIQIDGADTIVLGCGGMLQIGENVSRELNAPLIVPALAALKICETLIQMNVSQSKIAFPLPRKKKRLS